MSDKIAERHLQRKALVYVRQSTLQQLNQNEESRRLQYAMQDRVRELGWRSLEVIDDDLGCSAAGSADRPGFRRLIAEVSLGGIGAVAARELSRFARNSRDWQQLIEVCRFVDTVLVDQEGIYDPRNSNDRLLLGLKGSLNEYELELLRLRAAEARLAKARRGEFLTIVPVGFCRNEDGEIEKDPDMRVQQTVSLLFEKALELGGARGAMRWFRDHQLKLPAGPKGRKSRAKIDWKTPHYTRVLRILRNPTYAGAYAYGRRQSVPSFKDGRPQVKVQRRARDEWLVLLEDHHEGYISWASFERLQAMIDRNAQARWQTAPGAAKKGSALLSGLLRCRRCGRKLQVRYDSRNKGRASPRYRCDQASVLSGADACISFGAVDVDRRVSEELLVAVSPAALHAAELAHRESEDSQDELLDALETELEATRYVAERAFRQYDAADPENRLVAGELERRWEVSLAAVHDLEGRLEAARGNRTEQLTVDASVFREMAQDLRKVWDDCESDNKTKKRLVRTLIEEILADVDERGRVIELIVHWKGGVHTELRIPKRLTGRKRSSTSFDTVDAVRELALIATDAEISRWLNGAGVPGPSGDRWTETKVRTLRGKRKIRAFCPNRRREEGWLTLSDATEVVRAGAVTLKRAVQRGQLDALHPLPNGPWIFKRTDLLAWRATTARPESGRSEAADRQNPQLNLVISKTYQGGAV